MKRIQITIEGCADCPYLRFDDGAGEPDAGWDCKLARKRIVNEGDRWDFSDSLPDESGEELPMNLEGVMRACSIHQYPEWCPLPEVE